MGNQISNPANKSDRAKFVVELSKHPGWTVLKDEIEKKVKFKKDVLETCTKYDLDGHRGELKGLRFVLNKVEELTRGETENGR